MMGEHSPTPWELIEANENHGAYVVNSYGADVCDLYAMSNPTAWSVANGGDSRAVPFTDADANAAFIVKAVNSHDALVKALEFFADGNNWLREAECDPNSGNFRGTNVALEALASIKERA